MSLVLGQIGCTLELIILCYWFSLKSFVELLIQFMTCALATLAWTLRILRRRVHFVFTVGNSALAKRHSFWLVNWFLYRWFYLLTQRTEGISISLLDHPRWLESCWIGFVSVFVLRINLKVLLKCVDFLSLHLLSSFNQGTFRFFISLRFANHFELLDRLHFVVRLRAILLDMHLLQGRRRVVLLELHVRIRFRVHF